MVPSLDGRVEAESRKLNGNKLNRLLIGERTQGLVAGVSGLVDSGNDRLGLKAGREEWMPLREGPARTSSSHQ